jgi:hypothetical protein
MAKRPVSRELARERGLARYFTGKPCKHGHVAERLLSNGDCIVCASLRAVRWNKTPKGREYQRQYHRTPKMREYFRQRDRTKKRRARKRATKKRSYP